ncbi:MAG: Rrf2 family transcriptional regulator [Acidobacteriota bacterium]|jgi:Rrf2 family protein|nr:Rrf2 family transcriptional regulator [Acidobacteriota bacterium]
MISQKCQYAIRALFELARRNGDGPIKIGEIARIQSIPVRFLEVILNQLRQAGFVQSRRGAEGGYFLARPPDKIMIGEILQFVEGPLTPVACMAEKDAAGCPLHDNCAFIGLWKRAEKAASDVYNQTSLQDLVHEQNALQQNALSYSI